VANWLLLLARQGIQLQLRQYFGLYWLSRPRTKQSRPLVATRNRRQVRW
jgi:hypothetical protein